MVNPLSNKISVRQARGNKVPLKTLKEQMEIQLAREAAKREYNKARNHIKLAKQKALKARRAQFASIINLILYTLSC